MKKAMFSGLMVSLIALTSAAFAEEAGSAALGRETESTTLTTKNYVDDGLRAVYGVASNASTAASNAASAASAAAQTATTAAQNAASAVQRVGALETVVGDANSGLVQQVNQLAGAVEANEYNSGLGVTVDANNNINLTGLTDDSLTDDKVYVYVNGSFQELPVTDSWDPTVLTQP